MAAHFLLQKTPDMVCFHNDCKSDPDLSVEFAQSMLRATEKKYGALICAARKEWEHRFAGRDPADACVSVHTSAEAWPHDRVRMFPLEVDHERATGEESGSIFELYR
jgi:hypothetical protein